MQSLTHFQHISNIQVCCHILVITSYIHTSMAKKEVLLLRNCNEGIILDKKVIKSELRFSYASNARGIGEE